MPRDNAILLAVSEVLADQIGPIRSALKEEEKKSVAIRDIVDLVSKSLESVRLEIKETIESNKKLAFEEAQKAFYESKLEHFTILRNLEKEYADIVESLKALKPPAGERGEKGDVGPRGDQGPAGDRGDSISSISSEDNEIVIKLSNDSVHKFPMPIGQKGERGDKGDSGNGIAKVFGVGHKVKFVLTDGTEEEFLLPSGANGTSIEDIIQTHEDQIELLLDNGDSHKVVLPRGPKGDRGDSGENGRDRPLLYPKVVEENEAVQKNDIILHKGGVFIANRNARGTPEKDPFGYTSIVRGVDEFQVCADKDDYRNVKFSVKFSDGSDFENVIRIPGIRFRGLYAKDTDYQVDDIVVWGSASWIRVSDIVGSCDEPPSDGWKIFAKFPRGQKGERGSKGDPAAGIKDFEISDGEAILRLSDGTVLRSKIVQKSDPEDSDYPPLVRFRGVFDEDNAYRRGDIVRHGPAIYVSKTSIAPSSGSFDISIYDPEKWDLILEVTSYDSGSGTGGQANLPNPTPGTNTNIQQWMFDPTTGQGWQDARGQYRVYPTISAMNAVTPGHVITGTMAFNQETNLLYLWNDDLGHWSQLAIIAVQDFLIATLNNPKGIWADHVPIPKP